MKNLRAALCELFLGWSLRICPEGYSPSYVEAVLIAYDRGLNQKPLGKSSIAPSSDDEAAA